VDSPGDLPCGESQGEPDDSDSASDEPAEASSESSAVA